MNNSLLNIQNLSKTFTLHNQQETTLAVLADIHMQVAAGECVVLHGQSGQGKSTLLRCIYGSYLTTDGRILLNLADREIDLIQQTARQMIQLRRTTIAYVSQFLRIIPRVPALDIVMQPMLEVGYEQAEAKSRAEDLLDRLNLPQRLWHLSPTTFSGGEQQRINIAREFTFQRPLMLLDEPTASLDTQNREVVIQLILEAKQAGSAIVGIFHDAETRERVADRIFDDFM